MLLGLVAGAVRRLETRRPSARLVEPTRATLAAIAPELPFLRRLVLANADVLGPLVLRALASRPALDAAIRTTTATTLIRGGAKSNVLPERASAVVNFRILPGESVEDVITHARATVADARFAKPLDTALIAQLARHHGALITNMTVSELELRLHEHILEAPADD